MKRDKYGIPKMQTVMPECNDKAHAYLGRFKKSKYLHEGHNFSAAGLFQGLGVAARGASKAISMGKYLEDDKKKKPGQLFNLFKD